MRGVKEYLDNSLHAFCDIGDLDASIVFFFQAEDGIRDDLVTGVQTCALPIFHGSGPRSGLARTAAHRQSPNSESAGFQLRGRSEERRVGKECRSGWSPEE